MRTGIRKAHVATCNVVIQGLQSRDVLSASTDVDSGVHQIGHVREIMETARIGVRRVTDGREA